MCQKSWILGWPAEGKTWLSYVVQTLDKSRTIVLTGHRVIRAPWARVKHAATHTYREDMVSEWNGEVVGISTPVTSCIATTEAHLVLVCGVAAAHDVVAAFIVDVHSFTTEEPIYRNSKFAFAFE